MKTLCQYRNSEKNYTHWNIDPESPSFGEKAIKNTVNN